MTKKTTNGLIFGFVFHLLFAFTAKAQITPTVPFTTADHQRQCIGYITQWDAWKGTAQGVLPHSYNHLNIDYSQYTILNFSFFGVAQDGSLHSADFRNKQIYQSGQVQSPAALVNNDIYSSFDEFFLKGDVQAFWTVDTYLQGLGYVDNGNGTWKNTITNETGSMSTGIIEVKQNPAFRSIFSVAHSHNVKVMASVGGWSMCKHYGDVAADPAKRTKFTNDCKKLIAMGFDGIDIDWEYPGRSGMNFTGNSADFNNYALLIEEIRAAIGSTKLLTGCFSPVVKPNEFDWARLNNSMDYFNMMTYDYNGGWSVKAGHNAPLYDYPNEEYQGFSLDATLDSLIKRGVNLQKVNLGGAFYGRSVICSGNADLNATTVKVNVTVQPDGPISTAADYDNFPLDVWDGTPNYSYIVNNTGSWTPHWDNTAKVPYRTTGKYFLSYDDVTSIGAKAQYIKDHNLAGIIIWQVFGDLMNLGSCVSNGNKFPFCPNTTSPLINKINEVFASPSSSISGHTLSEQESTLVYPNPTNAEFQLNLSGKNLKNEIQIYNSTGQEVYKATEFNNTSTIDLSHLNKGIYLIRIANKEGITTTKLILE